MSTAATSPTVIGRFQIRDVLGAGAFGTVYHAFDSRLQREVALKVAHPGSLDDHRRAQRFIREARASAKLRHPNIVSVFDAGVDQGHHYIAAMFIDGRTLSEFLAADRPGFEASARLVRALAEALEHAHRQGIIHRDVKPANVRVDAQGEPHLLDFGIAHLRESSEKLTHDGAVLGTPAYMAPEQANWQTGKPLPASDQYSLGVVLYELLTGRTPFQGTATNLLTQVLTREPPSPRQLNRRVPRDLETVCLKAMAKAPGDRYPSCQELADDLRRWLDGEPIRARRLGLLERTARWIRREPVLALSTLAAAVALLAVAVVPLVLSAVLAAENRRAVAEKEKADKQTVEARKQEQEARAQSKRAREAKQAAEDATQRAAEWKDRASVAEQSKIKEEAESAKAIAQMKDRERDRPRYQYITDMQLAQDYHDNRDLVELKKRLTPYGPSARTDEEKNLAEFTWWLLSASARAFPDTAADKIDEPERVSLRFTPNGKEVLAISSKGSGIVNVERRNADLTREMPPAKVAGFEHDIALVTQGLFLSPDGTMLLQGRSATKSQLFRATGETWQSIGRELQHTGSVTDARFSPDGKFLATLHRNQPGTKVWIVDAPATAPVSCPFRSLQFTPDSAELVSTRDEMAFWDIKTQKQTEAPIKTGKGDSEYTFAPAGNRIAVKTSEEISIWDRKEGKQLHAFKGTFKEAPIFSADSKILAVRGTTCGVVWDIEKGVELGQFPPDGTVAGMTLSPDGRWLATIIPDGTATVWEVAR